jgi:hypothetical protein
MVLVTTVNCGATNVAVGVFYLKIKCCLSQAERLAESRQLRSRLFSSYTYRGSEVYTDAECLLAG